MRQSVFQCGLHQEQRDMSRRSTPIHPRSDPEIISPGSSISQEDLRRVDRSLTGRQSWRTRRTTRASRMRRLSLIQRCLESQYGTACCIAPVDKKVNRGGYLDRDQQQPVIPIFPYPHGIDFSFLSSSQTHDPASDPLCP